MAADDLLTLQQLLAPRAPATPGRRYPAPSAPPAAATPHAQLDESLGSQLGSLDALFARWRADVLAKQRGAARDFADDASFSLALVVLNKRGERRRGHRAAQEWYLAQRTAAAPSSELPCSRCCLHIARRQPYWVDRAAPSRAQADELCRRCVLCVMRALLGEDDTAILAEAQAIVDSAWQPTLNAALLEALGGGSQRGTLAEL